jgi:hypothetical protein
MAKPACPAVDRGREPQRSGRYRVPSRRFDRAGRRVSIVLVPGVIRADMFVVRREYYRTDFVMLMAVIH